MNVKILNAMAFLSGCFPVFFIHLLFNLLEPSTLLFCSKALFFMSSVSLIIYIYSLHENFKIANQADEFYFKNFKRRDIFGSGSISFYILPFISFVGTDTKNTVILVAVTFILLVVFINNRMFLYTPVIDCLGYKILECEMFSDNQSINVTILVKSTQNVTFTGINSGKAYKVEEGIYFVIFNDLQ